MQIKRFIPAFIALISALIILIMMGMRNDSERVGVADDRGEISFDVSEHSSIVLFTCVDEKNSDVLKPDQVTDENGEQIPVSKQVTINKLAYELSEPRPLDVPEDISLKFGISTRMSCGVTEKIDVNNTDDDGNAAVRISTIPGNFVVAAVSNPVNTPYNFSIFFLFAVFLVSIWLTFSNASKHHRLYFVHLKAADGIFGFLIGMALIIGLNIAFVSLLPPSDKLFPDYVEMLGMFLINFVSFIAVAAGYVAFRKKRPGYLSINDENRLIHDVSCDNSSEDKSAIEKSGKIPHFKPFVALITGFVLAVLAAISVLFAPPPGLSTAEMASDLTSTLYLTSIFAVLAGFSEECLFRGVIQSAFEARDGDSNPKLRNAIAIAIASVLFVSIHVAQSVDHLWALIPIATVSIVNGIMKVKFRSLFPCILVHMTYNATLLLPSLIVI